MSDVKKKPPFRHPYGDCISNIPINKLIEEELPYYPIFAYGFTFEYVPEEGKVLGDSILTSAAIADNYWNTILRVYGIEFEFNDKDENKDIFLAKIGQLLDTSSVPCLIDCYYDPSTEYANVYQKVHGGHGRIVTEIDAESVYYYATHVSDPKERFSMSRDDFYLACMKVISFRYSTTPKRQEERHAILKEILLEWFVETDYHKMFEDLEKFSKAVRTSPNLGDEIDNQFPRNKVPVSHLFSRLVLLCRSRGATIAFIQGYMDEFGNHAYQLPLQHLQKSLERWELVKSLLVKYGMAPKQSLQESMADYLLQIRDLEQEAVVALQKVICDEIGTNLRRKG